MGWVGCEEGRRRRVEGEREKWVRWERVPRVSAHRVPVA